jgi:hypothetical protein
MPSGVEGETLLLHDVDETLLHGIARQRTKAKARAARLKSRNDLGQVVANEAKPTIARVLLDDATQRGLRGGGHRVSLVQNDEFATGIE